MSDMVTSVCSLSSGDVMNTSPRQSPFGLIGGSPLSLLLWQTWPKRDVAMLPPFLSAAVHSNSFVLDLLRAATSA